MLDEVTTDALVVGAGFGGIYAVHRLSEIGLNVKCIEVADDVGGTWYWNRYPGAMSDTESYLYRYSWDKEDLQTYPWSAHYLYQPDILQYLRHIVDKFDLRRMMEFKVEMTSAQWNGGLRRWRVETGTGKVYLARYLVNCLGVLSKPNYPAIPGLDSFAGQMIHTARWDNTIELHGKKVGILGNGSTGIQRHPQYSVPSGQGPTSLEYRERINSNYDCIWDNVRSSAVGFGVPETSRKAVDATPRERQEAFQEAWDRGNGFRFMFSAFGDLTSDETANEAACEFIRGKIASIIKDPRKATILQPRDLYARRPLCDSGYYKIFNRDNVDVVDLKATPITRVSGQGIELSDGTVHDFDVLIFATGFDAIEGNYLRLNISGRNGETIKHHWQDGPTAYGGIACSGFPNMFLVSGPQAPFANFPPVIESEIEFIMSCISHAEKATPCDTSTSTSWPTVEATREAECEWSATCDRLIEESLFKRTASWIFGTNVGERGPTTNFYFGGLGSYRKWVQGIVAGGFPGFNFAN